MVSPLQLLGGHSACRNKVLEVLVSVSPTPMSRRPTTLAGVEVDVDCIQYDWQDRLPIVGA